MNFTKLQRKLKSYFDSKRRDPGKPHPQYQRNVETLENITNEFSTNNLWKLEKETNPEVPEGFRYIDIIFNENGQKKFVRINMHGDNENVDHDVRFIMEHLVKRRITYKKF